MRENVQQLKTSDITSEVYTISPTQMEYIARIFGDKVADELNMRAFSARIRQLAYASLRHALNAARHAGEQKA